MLGMFAYLKNTAKHTLIFSLSGIISKAIGFFLLPLYTHYLSPADYGILEILSLVLNISIFFITQGLPSALFRSYSYEYADNESLRKKAISSSIAYVSIVGIIFSGCFWLSAAPINRILFGTKDYSHFIRMIAITVFFITASHIPSALLRAKLKSVQLSVSSIIYLLSNIALNLHFIVNRNMGLRGLIYGNLIAAVLFAVILFFLILKDIAWVFSGAILRKMLGFGVPLIPAGLALFLMNGSDRFFLQHFGDSHQVGLYAVGYKIAAIISFILFEPFLLVWPSIYFKAAAEPDGPQFFSRFATVFLLVTSFASLGAALLSKPVIMLLTPPEFWEAAAVCPWLVLGFALNGISNILNVGLYIKRRTPLVTAAMLIATAFNLLLDFALIPSLGILGAALSMFLTFLVLTVASHRLSQRIYPIHYPWKKITKNISVFALCFVGSFLIPSASAAQALLRALSLLILFILGLWLCAYFSRADLEALARVKRQWISRRT